jgi:hypothetical protein
MSLVYIVESTFSPTEVSTTTIDSVFTDRADAEQRCKKLGENRYYRGAIRQVRLFGSFTEWLEADAERRKSEALRKLSNEEKKLLGLKT